MVRLRQLKLSTVQSKNWNSDQKQKSYSASIFYSLSTKLSPKTPCMNPKVSITLNNHSKKDYVTVVYLNYSKDYLYTNNVSIPIFYWNGFHYPRKQIVSITGTSGDNNAFHIECSTFVFISNVQCNNEFLKQRNGVYLE